MYIVFGNYGNDTLALVQWLRENNHSDITVVHIDTGFCDEAWKKHVTQAQDFVSACGFQVIGLTAAPNFTELMQSRGNFPSAKFPWCATALKGQTFLQWLTRYDPDQRATIILPKRRAQYSQYYDLPEHIKYDAHYARACWNPLFLHSHDDCLTLLKRAQITPLRHMSLECSPCVRQTKTDLMNLSSEAIARTSILETNIEKTLFEKSITDFPSTSDHPSKPENNIYKTRTLYCGAPYVCGL